MPNAMAGVLAKKHAQKGSLWAGPPKMQKLPHVFMIEIN
jgi:hypothetical protein